MITLTYIENEKVNTTSDLDKIIKISTNNFLWVDILQASKEEKLMLKKYVGINLLSLNKIKKIEHSSRFVESEDELIINSNILVENKKGLISKPVSFILKNNFLVSYHNELHLSFDELHTEIKNLHSSKINGKFIFLKIFENIIDIDIDLIEDLTKDIFDLSKKLSVNESFDEKLIYKLTRLQETLMILRRNIIDKQRVFSSISKSEFFSKKSLKKHIAIIEKDISSLLDYTTFDFERLEYLQDSFMGLINMKQNTIMKIFTIVSVIFLPPTLIASIYGMNFANMPELNVPYAYPIAIAIMFFVSLLTLFIFKLKKWI